MKEKLLKALSPVHNFFSQEPLGIAIAGGAAGSLFTYLFGYTSMSKARDEAIKELKRVNKVNSNLLEANSNLSSAASTLFLENNNLLKKSLSYKHARNRCYSDIDLIKALHNNSYFFKPDISHIQRKNTKSNSNSETEIPQNNTANKPS